MPILHVLEPMTRFRCNQQGCCCSGWAIEMDADDVFALHQALPPAQRADLLTNARMRVDGDIVRTIRLATVGRDKRCRFLAAEGACSVHATLGAQVLPHLCRVFPAIAFQRADGAVQVQYDPVCPEVLERLDEGDGPLEILRAPAEDHPDVAARADRPVTPPARAIGTRELELEAFDRLRGAILEAFRTRERPALDVLALVSHGLARVALGHPFEVRPDDPIAPFERYLDEAFAAHHHAALLNVLGEYRQFIFAGDLPEGPWDGLEPHLRHAPGWREVVDPRDPALDPLVGRYLANRFFNAYERSRFDNQIALSYGVASFALATALRYLVGLCRWLGRAPERELLKVCLGASEFFYRTVTLDPLGLPWFGLTVKERAPEPQGDAAPR